MNRRHFAASVAASLAALTLPRSGQAAVPAHPTGRTIMHLHLRATREFPEFPMGAGENLILTFDDGQREPMRITFEDCTEGPMSRADKLSIADGLRDGGLIVVTMPTADQMLRIVDSQLARTKARLAQIRSSTS